MGEREFSNYMDRNRTNPEEAMSRLQEGQLSETGKIERLRQGAHTIIEAHKKDVVPKVQGLLVRYGSYEKIPDEVCTKLADEIGGYEPEMIRAIAMELSEDK